MFDYLMRWPVRIGILGAIVSANVAGDCGNTRPTVMGNGGAGAIVSASPAPAYQKHDTAATTIGAATGGGVQFNPGDVNRLSYVTLQRGWTREVVNLSAGGSGYQGRYTLAPDQFGPGHSLAYRGAQLFGTVGLHSHRKQIEWRPLAFSVAAAREWGEWSDFRRAAPSGFVRVRAIDSARIGVDIVQRSKFNSFGYARLSTGFVTIPRRRWAPAFGLDGGLFVTNQMAGLDLQLQFGMGPIRLFGRGWTLAEGDSSGRWQWGLQYQIPPLQRR